MNSWPGGYRHAISQANHEKWNANHYPGTLLICIECGDPTGNCEEDGVYNDDGDPLCESCHMEAKDA